MICVGGTFEYLHRGHRALLETAFSLGKPVCIGLTSDDFAASGRDGRSVPSYEQRKKALISYLEGKGYANYEIFPLEDRYGDALDERYTDIVVSEETASTAREINEIRLKKGLEPLRIHTVPHILAEDFLPISSTRIAAGEIDAEGRLRRPLKVRVGSINPNKVDAVKAVISMFYRNYVVEAVRTDSGVSEQPFGGETVEGAINRAKKAMGDADLGIGIEAGLFEIGGENFDVQYCAIIDRRGWMTLGHGPGFYYPKSVMVRVKKGMSVSEAMKEVFRVENIGYREGAIGFLTGGRYDRRELTKAAVFMAFVPRIKSEIYRMDISNDKNIL